MELVGLIVGVISVIVAIIALRKDHYSKPKDEMEFLIVTFKATQKQFLEVEKGFEEYVDTHNAYLDEMWPQVQGLHMGHIYLL